MKVFLSHSHKDRHAAELFTRTLEEHGLDVWSGLDVPAGSNFAREAGHAIESSDAFVVLLSPDAVNSDLIKHEIDFALTHQQFEGRLISVMLRDTGLIPWILQKLMFVDATSNNLNEVAANVARMLKDQAEVAHGHG